MNFKVALKAPIGNSPDHFLIVPTGWLDRNRQPKAKVEFWNGDLLHSDTLNTGKEQERNRYIKACLETLKKLNSSAPPPVNEKELSVTLLTIDANLPKKIANESKQKTQIAPPTDIPYEATPDGLIWKRPTKDGELPARLTNFTALVTGDVVEDDGAESRCVFEIEADLKGRKECFQIAASQFTSMRWPVEKLGTSAVVYPGSSEHARCAIQLLSGDVPRRHIFTHTGWRKVGGEWVYLHAGGAIGQKNSGVDVRLDSGFSDFSLPDPPTGGDLKRALLASLELINVARRAISIPCLAATYRVVLGPCDFSPWLTGSSGLGKTEFAALLQQHFGSRLDARHLPASWASTENALEAKAFTAKDALLVVDDFAPTGNVADIARLHRVADRLLRAQGNSSGRSRMWADGTLRPERYPRGMIIGTGEDVPKGKSLRARLFILEFGPDDLDWDRLTQAQADGAGGLLMSAMSGFMHWVAPQYEIIQQNLKAEMATLRDLALRSGQHRRTPGIIANLALGLRYLLRYSQASGVLSREKAEEIWQLGWEELGKAAINQSRYQEASDPVQLFLDLLQAAIASGRAHIAMADGGQPPDEDAAAFGWEYQSGFGYRAKGCCIGWSDGDDLYLERNATMAEVQKMGQQTGDALTITPITLYKRLQEKGLLLSVEGTRGTLYIRRKLGGATQHVLHHHKKIITEGIGGMKRLTFLTLGV